MSDDESPDIDEENMEFKSKKINPLPRRKWQGREDADMLMEKQTGWHCGSDDFDGFDDRDSR